VSKHGKRKADGTEADADDEEGTPLSWDVVGHPPILSRTPTPEPGTERDLTPNLDDPDGLFAPSVLTTIEGPDGRTYREFRQTDPETGEEKMFWVLVRQSKGKK
jgi:hypothetical protein